MRRTVFNFTTAANSAVFKNAGSFLLCFGNLFFWVEDHARIPYELKPVINYNLGWGGKGLGWRIFGDQTTFRGYWGGVSCRQHSIKGDYIENCLPINCWWGGWGGEEIKRISQSLMGRSGKIYRHTKRDPFSSPPPPRLSIMTAPFVKEFNLFLCAAGPF